MRAPSQRADDMTEALHGLKRRIERRPANPIVDHLKAAAGGVSCDVVLDIGPIVVDRRCAELFDEGQASRRAGCEHLGADRPRSWTATWPTPPAPPWTSTVWPGFRLARST